MKNCDYYRPGIGPCREPAERYTVAGSIGSPDRIDADLCSLHVKAMKQWKPIKVCRAAKPRRRGRR